MHRIILFKCPRRSIAELFSASLLPKRGNRNGPFLLESFQTIAGSNDPSTFRLSGDKITNSLGLQVVNALQLGNRSKASEMLLEVGVVSPEYNAEDIVCILEYCARLPDPLFGMETWRVLEARNVALSWKCYLLIVRALSNGGYLEEALDLMKFVGENNRISFVLPMYNSFLLLCANMKDMRLFSRCLDLMERQCLGKNEVTYMALLKLAVWQKNLSAVHDIWREHHKHYNVNLLGLRMYIWSFTRLNDFKSAYKTLQHMVITLRKMEGKEGKISCIQLDIPILSGSVMGVGGFDLKKKNLSRIKLLDDHKYGPIKKILTWSFNDVIRACGYRGKAVLAKKLMKQMQNLGLKPSSCTYHGLARAIISRKRANATKNLLNLLEEMQRKNLKPCDATLSFLSICFSKALKLDLAEDLLNQISAGIYAFPYNRFLRACVLMDKPERAVKMFAKMRKMKIKPTIKTYEQLFSLLGNVNVPYEESNLLSHGDVAKRIRAIEMDMLENGIHHSQLSMMRLLKALGDEGMVQELLKYWHRAESQSGINNIMGTGLYNTVLHLLVKAKENHKAVEIFRNMKLSEVRPDDRTYCIMIDCCSNIRCFKSACALVSMMIRDGFPPNTVTYTALIKILMKYDAFDDALDLLDQAISDNRKTDLESFNTILYKASSKGRIDVIETVVQAMHQEKIQPNHVTCGCVFTAYVYSNFHDTAVEALQVLSLRMISLNNDALKTIKEKYMHLILSEEEEDETQILKLFENLEIKGPKRGKITKESANLGVALLNLRWCSMAGATISWVPNQSPWAIRLASAPLVLKSAPEARLGVRR